MSDIDPTQPLNQGVFSLALTQERKARGLPLNLSIVFRPEDHPRDLKGQFKKALGSLKPGQSLDLPDGTSVLRNPGGNDGMDFKVVSKGGETLGEHNNPDRAAERALHHSATSKHKDSLGGPVNHRDTDSAIRAQKAINATKPSTPQAVHDQAEADLQKEMDRQRNFKPSLGTGEPPRSPGQRGRVEAGKAQDGEPGVIKHHQDNPDAGAEGDVLKWINEDFAPALGPDYGVESYGDGSFVVDSSEEGAPRYEISNDDGEWQISIWPTMDPKTGQTEAEGYEPEDASDYITGKTFDEAIANFEKDYGKLEKPGAGKHAADAKSAAVQEFEKGHAPVHDTSTEDRLTKAFGRIQIDDSNPEHAGFSLPGGDDEEHEYYIERAKDSDHIVTSAKPDEFVLTEYPFDAYDDDTDEYDPEMLTHHALGATSMDEAIKKAHEILKDRIAAGSAASDKPAGGKPDTWNVPPTKPSEDKAAEARAQAQDIIEQMPDGTHPLGPGGHAVRVEGGGSMYTHVGPDGKDTFGSSSAADVAEHFVDQKGHLNIGPSQQDLSKLKDGDYTSRDYANRPQRDLSPDDLDLLTAHLLDDTEHDPWADASPELGSAEDKLFNTGEPLTPQEWDAVLHSAKRDYRDAHDPQTAEMGKEILDRFGDKGAARVPGTTRRV